MRGLGGGSRLSSGRICGCRYSLSAVKGGRPKWSSGDSSIEKVSSESEAMERLLEGVEV